MRSLAASLRALAAAVGIVATVACGGGGVAKPPANAKASEPAPVAPATRQTDDDCKPNEVCVHEQVRDDPEAYDPNATDGPNRPPVMEETATCQPGTRGANGN